MRTSWVFFLGLSLLSATGHSVLTENYNIPNIENNFVRSDQGQPITPEERQQATTEFVSLLKDLRYFDFIASRVHGVPEKNSTNSFWYSSMWTGVQVSKRGGHVTYTHQNNGSDNIGIHSAPYMEGACHAFLLTGDSRYSNLARRLIRGFSAWILSSSRSEQDEPKILSRSFYPAGFSSDEAGRQLTVNYEASRPGINAPGTSSYVHIPNNPYFGDLWVKNRRSTDDIGQMIRGMAQVQACRSSFDAETRADLDQMNHLYARWAENVEQSKFVIPTFDLNAEIYIPKGDLGDFTKYDFFGLNPNCTAKMAIRLLHSNNSSDIHCNCGISFLEYLLGNRLRNDAMEILRYQHISAIAMADLNKETDIANKLRQGLANRMDRAFKVVQDPSSAAQLDIQDIPTFLVHSGNVGVAMTSEEIRFVYQRLHTAYLQMRDPVYANTFHLFDTATPDGDYSYDAPNAGLYFYTLAPMVGACSSPWAQNSVRPLWDCDLVKAGLLD